MVDQFDTGDVFLFHGDFPISRLIEAVTGSRYSHVGMVFRMPGAPAGRELFLWHAATKKVMLMPLRAALKDYPEEQPWGTFAWRKLTVERTLAMRHSLHDFMGEALGTPFPTDEGMMLHWLEGQIGIDSGEKTFFCAQLVAETYKRMGLLPASPVSNRYAPKDFTYEHHDLALMAGASLGDEVVIDLDDKA